MRDYFGCRFKEDGKCALSDWRSSGNYCTARADLPHASPCSRRARRPERHPRFHAPRWFASANQASHRLYRTGSDDIARQARDASRPTLEAKDFKTSTGQVIAQMNAKFSSGRIGQATHLIDRFVTWAAGDDDFRGFQMANACFIRRTSACNCRASCLRSAFLSRNCLKCSDA